MSDGSVGEGGRRGGGGGARSDFFPHGEKRRKGEKEKRGRGRGEANLSTFFSWEDVVRV